MTSDKPLVPPNCRCNACYVNLLIAAWREIGINVEIKLHSNEYSHLTPTERSTIDRSLHKIAHPGERPEVIKFEYVNPSKPEREWTREDYREFSTARGEKIRELCRKIDQLEKENAELRGGTLKGIDVDSFAQEKIVKAYEWLIPMPEVCEPALFHELVQTRQGFDLGVEWVLNEIRAHNLNPDATKGLKKIIDDQMRQIQEAWEENERNERVIEHLEKENAELKRVVHERDQTNSG